MACWITFFAAGARRNSSRSVLYSRLADIGFLRVDGITALLGYMYGNTPYYIRATVFVRARQSVDTVRRRKASSRRNPTEKMKRRLIPLTKTRAYTIF